jgi:hypothetical protein
VAIVMHDHTPATTPATTPANPATPATVDRPRHLRRLRATSWTLARLLRHPARIPGAWRSPQFAARLDRVRIGLLPIRSLAALADSYSREHAHDDPAVRLAYALRWLELSAGLDERPWRLHWSSPPGSTAA